MKAELSRTISFDQMGNTGDILDIATIESGTLLWDIHVHVTEAWNNAAVLDFGFVLNTMSPIFLINGAPDASMDITHADSNDVISGSSAGFYPLDQYQLAAGSSGFAYLPGIMLQTAILQVRMTSAGPDPATTGELEVRVIYELAADMGSAVPFGSPPSGSLVFPGMDPNTGNANINILNVVGQFHAERMCTVDVTIDSDITYGAFTWRLGITDPTGGGPISPVGGPEEVSPVPAGTYTFHLSAGDWWIYLTHGTDYESGLTGSGSYSVTYP